MTMTTDKKETSPQPMPQFYPQYLAQPEDEINLVDLWLVLVKRWRLIFSVIVVSVVIAVALALWLPRTYQAEIHLLPPLEKDVQGMQGMQGMKPEDVFIQVQGNLKSKAALKVFFEAEKLIDILAPERNAKLNEQSVLNAFQESFHFNADKKDKRLFSVTLDWSDQEQVADLLNRYIEMIAAQTKKEILSKAKGDLLQNKITVEQAIASKRAMAAQRRSDEIARLSEALLIAQTLNITNSESSSLLKNVDFSQSQESNPIALFSQGSNALQAQISALKSRKTDDPYIKGIRELQEQLMMLNNKLLVFNDDFKVVRIDQQAFRPDSPIKPKKRLIVALGGVLGLMLGIFAAFFFNFVENNRKEEGTEA